MQMPEGFNSATERPADQMDKLADGDTARLIIAERGDYGFFLTPDSYSGKVYPRGAVYRDGAYRMGEPWGRIIADSWENLARAFMRENRLTGRMTIAFRGIGVEYHYDQF